MPNDDNLQQLKAIVAQPQTQIARSQLQAFLQTNAIGDATRYAWAFPTVGSTDERVAAYLIEHPADTKFEPCLYQAHLSEASTLLDRCLARRDQIYALESVALTTLLDYLFAETTQPNELALAKLALKATRNQATAVTGDPGDDVLEAQFDARTKLRNARLALHAQDGNPLNYQQRIDDLRELFADDIRSIYELLTAARIGMNQALDAKNQRPVPKWNKTRTDNLKNLVIWCREVIRHVEVMSQNEVIYKKVFFLKADALVTTLDMMKTPGTGKWIKLQFKLEKKHFQLSGPQRIINVGVAFAGEVLVAQNTSYDLNPDRRAQQATQKSLEVQEALRESTEYAFRTLVGLPKQVSQFDISDEPPYQWARPAYLSEFDTSVWQSLEKQQYPSASSIAVLNTNPLGDWVIWINQSYRKSDGKERPLSERATGSGWQITDVVLFMTVVSLYQKAGTTAVQQSYSGDGDGGGKSGPDVPQEFL